MNRTRPMVYMSLFIAMEIVLTRFLSLQTPVVRIGFTFLPIVISAIMFGPLISGVGAAIADVIGMMLFPVGTYFPGFTLTAFMTGALYGVFLYKKPVTIVRSSVAVVVTLVVCNLFLDTLWLYMLMDRAIMVLLPARLFKCLTMVPIQIGSIQVIWKYLSKYLSFNPVETQ